MFFESQKDLKSYTVPQKTRNVCMWVLRMNIWRDICIYVHKKLGGFSLGFGIPTNLIQELPNMKIGHIQGEMPGLYSGEVQNLIQHLHQTLGGALHDAHKAGLLWRQGSQAEQIQHAQNTCHTIINHPVGWQTSVGKLTKSVIWSY